MAGASSADVSRAGTEWGERHERDAALGALLEYLLRSAVGGVVGVLRARDVGEPQRVEQVRHGDVAQADFADQAVVAGLDHGGELVVERCGLAVFLASDGG